MNDKALHKLYELKGRLAARCVILEDERDRLERLANQVETAFYQGYIQGQMDMTNAQTANAYGYFEAVKEIIMEAEDDSEDDEPPF